MELSTDSPKYKEDSAWWTLIIKIWFQMRNEANCVQGPVTIFLTYRLHKLVAKLKWQSFNKTNKQTKPPANLFYPGFFEKRPKYS